MLYNGNKRHPWPAQDDLSEPAPAWKQIPTDDSAWQSMAAVLLEMTEVGEELTEDRVQLAIKMGRARYERKTSRRQAEEEREAARAARPSWVYYVRRGVLVKIGTTVDLHGRFRALLPDEILAVEPGSYELESERHLQFHEFRVPGQREYFYPSAPLQQHITEVRAAHGDPEPNLPVAPPTGAS